MTEPAFDFIQQPMFINDMIKTAFLIHVQNACTEKNFKNKIQTILKWVHDHQLPQNNSILMDSVAKKWKDDMLICTAFLHHCTD